MGGKRLKRNFSTGREPEDVKRRFFLRRFRSPLAELVGCVRLKFWERREGGLASLEAFSILLRFFTAFMARTRGMRWSRKRVS